MKVLVAEDDRSTRLLLETTLLRWGYDVSTASNGNDAWELIQGEDPPELVILDWMMPDMDGVEVCQKISEAQGLTPPYVILLTSRGRREDIVEGLRCRQVSRAGNHTLSYQADQAGQPAENLAVGTGSNAACRL